MEIKEYFNYYFKRLNFNHKNFGMLLENNDKFKAYIASYATIFFGYNIFVLLYLKKLNLKNFVISNSYFLSITPFCYNNLIKNESILNTDESQELRNKYIEEFKDDKQSYIYKKINYLYKNINKELIKN